MGISTFIEINHDRAHDIEQDPKGFGELMAQYTRSCDSIIALELKLRFGVEVWKSASRNEWENEVRSVLSREYRERLESIREKENLK